MQKNKNVLITRNIAKSFTNRQVLKDISFAVRKGEIVGIEGENGAGKTTLLKILVGLLKADNGNLTIYGNSGYCPQQLQLFEFLSVQRNFNYFVEAYHLPSQYNNLQIEEKIKELMERFRFSQYENETVGKLSGGTRQKLNLCLALVHDPDILILDEPFAAFDWETYLHFWEYVKEKQQTGKTFLIVSHIIYDKSVLNTRYHLKDGVLQCVYPT